MVYGDELYHHGIKGQKWGIRRFQPYSKGSKKGKEVGKAAKGSSLKERNESIIADRKKALSERRHLSDDELRKRINRLRLEEDFKNLSKRDINKGKSEVRRNISNKLTMAAATVVAGSAIYAIRQLILRQKPTAEGFVNAALPLGNKKKK